MFSAFVIVYLFLGGFGSGLLLISAFSSLVFHCALDRNEIEEAAFDEWRNRCFLWGFVIVLCGALCLLLDLGRPERFVMLFMRPSSVSVLAYGTMFLTALIVCSGFLVFANYIAGRMRIPIAMHRIGEVVCSLLSIAVMAYTGVYLMSTQAVAFWTSPLIVALFVASALSMGFSGCAFAGSLLRDAWMLEDANVALRWGHIIALAIEACLLASFLAGAMNRGGRAADSCMLLFSGDLEVWFLGGVVMCGLAIPLIREVAPASLRQSAAFPVSDVLCVFGGLALRLCLVSAGLH